jgi:hypothetical protein
METEEKGTETGNCKRMRRGMATGARSGEEMA